MENLENEKNYKSKLGLFIIVGILILVIAITLIVLNLNLDKDNNSNGNLDNNKIGQNDNSKNDESSNLDDNDIEQNDDNENNQLVKFKQYDNITEILLSEPTETYNIDNDLKIEFLFSNEEYGEKRYKANIYLNGKNINNSFFDGSDRWHAVRDGLQVYSFDNCYVLYSGSTTQCELASVLIINKEGTILKAYPSIQFEIDKTIAYVHEMDIDDCGRIDIDTPMGERKTFDLKDLK